MKTGTSIANAATMYTKTQRPEIERRYIREEWRRRGDERNGKRK